MSTQEKRTDTSLNNLPERLASGSTAAASSLNSTNDTNKDQTKSGGILADNDQTDAQNKAPVDKHGDTWAGGVSHVNKEFK